MDEYYDYEEPWKRKFEMTIPILLLVLVLVIIAWKTGIMCSIPVLGDAICGGTVNNILIVGNDADIIKSLDEMKTSLSINSVPFTEEDISNLGDASYLDKYDLIILTEEVMAKDSDLPSIFRMYLADKLSKNGKLILYGIAGSTDPAESSINGWVQHGMDKYIPVSCTTGICTDASKDTASVDVSLLKIKDINHEMLKEFGTSATIPTGTNIEYTIVNLATTTKELITLEVERAGTQAYPAVVEMNHGMGGKTIYFSYHPSRTPTIFKNAVKYILEV